MGRSLSRLGCSYDSSARPAASRRATQNFSRLRNALTADPASALVERPIMPTAVVRQEAQLHGAPSVRNPIPHVLIMPLSRARETGRQSPSVRDFGPQATRPADLAAQAFDDDAFLSNSANAFSVTETTFCASLFDAFTICSTILNAESMILRRGPSSRRSGNCPSTVVDETSHGLEGRPLEILNRLDDTRSIVRLRYRFGLGHDILL